MQRKTAFLAFRADAELARAVTTMARRQGLSFSAFMRQVLEAAVERQTNSAGASR